MGHNHRLAPNERKEERKHCWAGQKDLIGAPDQLPQMHGAGLANNAEWTAYRVFFISFSGLGHNSDRSFVGFMIFRCQPSSQMHRKGFDATDARRKKMRVEEELHPSHLRNNRASRLKAASGWGPTNRKL
jgi:hypothetical protein